VIKIGILSSKNLSTICQSFILTPSEKQAPCSFKSYMSRAAIKYLKAIWLRSAIKYDLVKNAKLKANGL